MENNTRQPFKKYKELRVYFGITQYSVIQYDCEGMEFVKAFDWFKFSSRGATFKDTNSGMTIHFKYSSVDGIDDNNSRALILEDVELFTPFIKENDEVKFITWEEWNEKYNPEAICKRITSVTDERLKEHGTDLMYILDKLCSCAANRTFDHPYRFIKVEPRYQDNEYSLHRVAAGFKWYHGCKIFDDIRYYLVYEAKDRTIHIDISKHATWYMPSPIFSSPFLSNTILDDHTVDAYSISVEFNKDYSISKVTVKNKNKENLLKFMEMGNPVVKNTIRQIRDYINAKLTEKQLTSRINITNENNKYVQTWNFSPRVDVRPNAESYDTEKEFTLNKYGDIYTQIKNECEWIYNHPKTTHTDELNRISTCSGYILYLSSGKFEEATRERIRFEFDTFATFHRITIEILDPNREKLKVTLGIEDSQLVSMAMSPGFYKFEKTIDRIYNPRIKRLVSEIFNKLYKGEE